MKPSAVGHRLETHILWGDRDNCPHRDRAADTPPTVTYRSDNWKQGVSQDEISKTPSDTSIRSIHCQLSVLYRRRLFSNKE